jgi:hypothetical protein
MNTKEKAIYIAGFIDGEGYITIIKGKNGYKTAGVMVTNTDKNILVFLKKEYGGSIAKLKIRKENHQQAYLWRVVCRGAMRVVKDIQPYVRLKKSKQKIKILLNHEKKLIIKLKKSGVVNPITTNPKK